MKEKKLSDYLHFYLGQEMLLSGIDPEIDGRGRLVNIDLSGRIGVIEDMNINYCVEVNLDDLKPILRRLSSMTEEEKKDLFAFIFRRPFPDSGRILFFDKATTQSDPRYVLMTGVERLGIEMNGTVWADSDLHNYKHNQHAVTAWMLKKGFWLFGDSWFTEGLIIDKDTV